MTLPGQFQFISNHEQFAAQLKVKGSPLHRVAREEFIDLQETWVTRMKKQQFSGYYPGLTRGRKLRARSGHLRSSAGGRVSGTSLKTLKAVLRIGGMRGYARIQEEGGTVVSKSGGWLTIPLPAALRPRTGTPNPRAKIRKEIGFGHGVVSSGTRYVTDIGPTFIIRGSKGPIIMARRKDGTIVPLYALRRSVKIAPRLNAGNQFQTVARQKLPELGERMLRVLVGGGT